MTNRESLTPTEKPEKETARQTYNRLSRWYDLLSVASEKPACRQGLQMLDPAPGEHVLEVGSGTGESLLLLAEAVGSSGLVHGIDLSDGMIAVARTKLVRAGILGITALICGDAVHMPYAGATLDAVFCAFTLELFDTPVIPQVLTECRRVLRPGGRLGIVSLSERANPNWITRVYDWTHKKFPAYIDCRPIEVCKVVERAGFEVSAGTLRSMWGLPVEIIIGKKA
jgi:demethylmenaquinone methyltransferase/2-methoxy-6-polyprenyl-1,4-benzoquinol methylase